MTITKQPPRHAAIHCRSVIHAHGSSPAAAETVNVRSSTELSGKPPVSLRLSNALYSARKPLPQFIRCHRNPSVYSFSENCYEDASKDFTNDGLLRRASLVGAATIASKILGLFREIALASVIGVGPVATAFNHAVVLPRFSSSFLGAVNGPIHITAATTLSKISSENRRQLTQKVQTIMLLIGGAFAALTYIFAEDIIFLSAPGLWVLTNGQLIREMAMTQLKLMIPCILVAGSLGIGFGCLTRR